MDLIFRGDWVEKMRSLQSKNKRIVVPVRIS